MTSTLLCIQDADTAAAPLFGRGDHAASEQALTVRDRCDLLVRASFLVTVFLPFLLLGPLLLLLAAQFTPTAQAQGQAASLAAATPAAGPSEQEVLPLLCMLCCNLKCWAAVSVWEAVRCCGWTICCLCHVNTCCAVPCCAVRFHAVLC